MLNIKIDSTDLHYLIENLDKVVSNDIKRNHTKKFDTVYLNIERQTAEIILDFLGNELIRAGINEDDEPNEVGIMLENLIDKFSREIYTEDVN